MPKKEATPVRAGAAVRDGFDGTVSTSDFTTTDPTSQGPTVIAKLLHGDDPATLDSASLGEPYRAIAEKVAQAEPQERWRVFSSACASLEHGGHECQKAVVQAARELEAPLETDKPRELGQRVPKTLAEALERTATDCPDLDLRKEFFYALIRSGEKHRPLLARRQLDALAVLEDWLQEHGSFVRDQGDGCYYFWRDERRLFDVRSSSFAQFVYSLTTVNPGSRHFTLLLDHCLCIASTAPRRPVVKVAAWDQEEQVLRVSRFDGVVYVLDGERIGEEGNGENVVIFDDSPLWLPYEPEFGSLEPLHWLTHELPNWSHSPKMYGLALLAWILATFFAEICPTRPLATMVGEKGSGKSALLRCLLRLLFGPLADLFGIPDRPDGFTSAAAAAHILVLDNLDEFTPWLRDKLARIATGADDVYRKLYSNNEAGYVRYRCWVGITSRTPSTLKRDDLADRLLLLPVNLIGDDKRERETQIAATVVALRDAWWGAVLTMLNLAVASIRQCGLQARPRLRLADWEVLGRVFARNEGQEALWDELVEQILEDQSAFLLEDDLVVEGLARWMMDEKHWGKQMTAKDLHVELEVLLFDDAKRPRGWPKGAGGMGKKLSAICQALRTVYDVHREKGTATWNRGAVMYRFWPKGQMPQQYELEMS